MLAKTWSSAIQGVEAYTVEIEVNATGAGQENVVTVVGLPDTAVRESRERVWSALYTSGFRPPHGRTTINLAPTNIPFCKGYGSEGLRSSWSPTATPPPAPTTT